MSIYNRSQQAALNKLKKINKLIFEAEQDMVKLNGIDAKRSSKQFDFCTHSELASVVDGIKIKADHINDIVYQKKRRK